MRVGMALSMSLIAVLIICMFAPLHMHAEEAKTATKYVSKPSILVKAQEEKEPRIYIILVSST